MAALSSRQRVLTALSGKEPDRVPVDLGSIADGSIHIDAYQKLKQYLGIIGGKTNFYDLVQQAVMPEENVLQILGIDTRAITLKVPERSERRIQEDERGQWFVDEWGIAWRKPRHGFYFDMVGNPLKKARIQDLDDYRWPDPDDPARYQGLQRQARELFENTEYAIVGNTQLGSAFELNWYLTGLERFLTDMLLEPAFVEELIARSLEIQGKMIARFLESVGVYIQVLGIGDDLGTQTGPLLSPDLYRRLIKPKTQRLIRSIKSQTKAKILYHSCGSIVPFIPDFIELGIDALHPVQVSAEGMNTRELKRKFGAKITFWGAIDTQYVLPRGAPDEVEKEVQERIHDLGPGGGYILAAVHNIQRDVPPENILAMFDAARKYGKYPL